MSDEITPALTPDEWAQLTNYADDFFAGCDVLMAYMVGECSVHYDPKRPSALAAIANAALPDDDPRKITRAMVERMRQAATYIRAQTRREYGYDESARGNVPRHYMATADGIEDDAAKLAALLPPGGA